jgi:tRNA 2-(methylsulfanyl)-N6-isopentenyladenosine37 hydroxylase
MLRLKRETPASWAEGAVADLAPILLDHAHCEKKAASTAINLIFKYQHDAGLMRPLSALAREELEHFERMLDVLASERIPFAPLPPSPYAGRLYAAVRPSEPERLLDTLLVCALIEARSCDRMARLVPVLPPALASVYRDLLASEARHHATYVDLALERYDRDDVFARLAALAAHEDAVLTGPPEAPRLHARLPG